MSQLPLQGLKILDCTQFLSGPFCTMLLADMGADVVKVEKPVSGDGSRQQGPHINGVSAPFLMINRNKRSIAIDLKRPQGKQTFLRLIPKFDVLVENFRPGTMKELGLGYEDLRDRNPAMVYCSISGFGQTGPYSHRGGFDLVAQGMSGLISVTGILNGPPIKVGIPVADISAGMLAANGILSAYIHRLRTGYGQHVDTSLLEAAIAITPWESGILWATGKSPGPLGSAHQLSAPYQVIQCQDKSITVGAANQATWERLCRAIGREELLEDPRFGTDPLRRSHYQVLAQKLEDTMTTLPATYWLSLLDEAQVPCGPINNMAEVYADAHVQERDMELQLTHPVAGHIKNIGMPIKFSGASQAIRLAPPLLGQHSQEVLRENGFDMKEVAILVDSEVIRGV
jgi:crotonobetainyl-CoA:carnitine CoA-transferase CaiB-like acyl-CoA transferase